MTHLKIVFFLSFLMTLPMLSVVGQDSKRTADVAAIEALIQNVQAANNAGDVDAWVALFAENAVYMAPGAPPVETKDELIEVARAGFVHDADITIEPVEIQVLGEWAFARTQVSGTVRLHNSDDVVAVDVKQLAIYEKQQSRGWKIARLIMNSNKN